MSTVTIHIAREQDIERVAVLFDLYRQFYEQEPDLDLARELIKGRIINIATMDFVKLKIGF